MFVINLTVKEIFLIIGCAVMAHTQLDDLDLDSTIGVSSKIRSCVLEKLIKILNEQINNGIDYSIKINLEEMDYQALLGLTSHGVHWFNKSLFLLNEDDAKKLLQHLKNVKSE